MDSQDSKDLLSLIESELGRSQGAPYDAPDGFDEVAYLRAFADVAEAVRIGERKSALEHYLEHGREECRLDDLRYRSALLSTDTSSFPAIGIDVLFATRSGRCLIIGWINDIATSPIEIFILVGTQIVAATREVARCRRQDAESVVSSQTGKLLGFWSIVSTHCLVDGKTQVSVAIVTGAERLTIQVPVQQINDDRLREIALEYLAKANYFSNPQVESYMQLDNGVGKKLVDLNVEISRRIMTAAHVVRLGPSRKKFCASIVVCIYGKAEFLFLQAAFFSEAAEYSDYEFIYVSNSPELAEILVKEATLATRIYGASITLIILPSNAGFGAANNVAVNHARSRRILIVNPDVFPRDLNWARQHADIIKGRAPEQVAMFGVPLYYDDGSLMHAGMFIDSDIGLSVRHDMVEQREMLRVEHYGKGAPPNSSQFLLSRPVPAVTGAFISTDRGWFETLGGFSLEYGFGHYEDADLCLKSFSAGKPVWVHNVPFWHLEGKGSTRRTVHEGGSSVNRWHFTKIWGSLVDDGMRGPFPPQLPPS